MPQRLPHFATVSYAFRYRFTDDVIEGAFRWILEEIARAGYLSPEVIFVDRMHIKANANLESGIFHKGEYKKCFAYEAHTVCDRRGYVLKTEINPRECPRQRCI